MNWLLKQWFQRQSSRSLDSDSVLTQLPTIQLPTIEGQKRLSLAFNDGPTPYGTPALLRILDQFEIKATFFLIGENVVRHPKLVTEILAAGHTVGNHSFSHLDPWTHSVKETLRDVQKSVEVIEQLTSQSVDWYRPPFGHATALQVDYAKRYGLKTVLGEMVVQDDQKNSDPEKLTSKLLSNVKTGSIINFHDNQMSNKVTPKILCDAVPRLVDAGWEFEALRAA